jgi:F-type H+-transporting ATPase subunit alpha
MKQVAGRLRLDMANFRELAAFAQFGSDLDKATLGQLYRGLRLQEILKQPQYEPVQLEDQVLVLFGGINGYADSVSLDRINDWQKDLLKFFDTSFPEIKKSIAAEKRISTETEPALRKAMDMFIASWK